MFKLMKDNDSKVASIFFLGNENASRGMPVMSRDRQATHN